MEKYIKDIKDILKKNNFNDLDGAPDEKSLLYAYSLYHYYFGDDDYLLDIKEHIRYNKSEQNFAQAVFEEESYDERTLDILVPYYVPSEKKFDISEILYMITQTQSMIAQMRHRYYTSSAHENILRDYWDPESDDKIIIKVITNYILDFDQKQDCIDQIKSMNAVLPFISFDITFGDDIEDEIAQLTSNKKCVEKGVLILEKPNNYLTYGAEKSIITNIMASSLKDNYIKYGKAGLFSLNLRFYIQNKKVDEGLEKSIREKGDNFWYYNNGIIIVCDDFKIENNTITLKNYSIVNGGQTTRMIGVIPFDKDFAISCKIIKNKYNTMEENFRFVSEIAEASNTQKPISSTDIIANRVEQRILKDKLSDKKIFMQIKKGDSAIANLKENYPEPWQKTKNDELGQLIYGSLYQRPGTARNSKDKIFSDKRKYQMVFGESNFDLDIYKDLLILKAYYKKWSSDIQKMKDVDADKKGLVKNGLYFFLASAVLMFKFIYSKELCDYLLTNSISSEKGSFVIGRRTFDHRFLSQEYDNLKDGCYKLFELIYEKYIGKQYKILKSFNTSTVYSNFTKVDKNYINFIAPSIFDDFAGDINSRISAVMNPIAYVENDIDKARTKELVQKAIDDYDLTPKEDDEVLDPLKEKLKEKLIDYRTEKYKENNIKAYEVFTNKELESIINLKPKSTVNLAKYGCFKSHPRTKIKLYGKEICEIVNSIYGDE